MQPSLSLRDGVCVNMLLPRREVGEMSLNLSGNSVRRHALPTVRRKNWYRSNGLVMSALSQMAFPADLPNFSPVAVACMKLFIL